MLNQRFNSTSVTHLRFD